MREYAADWEALKATDPEVADAIAGELNRERTNLRLIASENYASPAVLAAVGSTMNNKYAEGYPGRRYYGGCEFVDVTEQLAIDRAKQLFGADHANVQPHAGAQANMAVFGAFLDPRRSEREGARAWCSPTAATSPTDRRSTCRGMWFNFVGYEVDRETEQLDMDRVRDLAKAAAAEDHPRRLHRVPARDRLRRVPARSPTRSARSCGSTRRHFIGLVAGGAYPSPVPHADVVTFTTHKTLRGPRGAMILCREEHAKAIDKAVFPMMQGGPLEHAIAGKAVALKEAMSARLRGRTPSARSATRAPWPPGSPTKDCASSPAGPTRTSILRRRAPARGRRQGGRGASATRSAIALNKNQIPYDPNPPSSPSGIRVGTPGVSTLGMDEPEMSEIASILGDALRAPRRRGRQGEGPRTGRST